MSWSFAHVSDVHVGTPRSFRYQPAWVENWRTARAQILSLSPDLLLIGGDLTRDGSHHRYELERMKWDLDRLPFAYHVIPGNHDVGEKSNGESPVRVRSKAVHSYEGVFGPSQWSFVHKGVRFSGLNALLAGSGLPEEAEMWEWLDGLQADTSVDHHVWMMHPSLFVDTLDEPNFDPFEERVPWVFNVDLPERGRLMDVFRRTRSSMVITSHVHCRRSFDLEGIRFVASPATAFPQSVPRWKDGDTTLGFLKFDVDGDRIEHELVPLEEMSSLEGYGAGGNPSSGDTDYSISWKKPSLKDLGPDAKFEPGMEDE